MNRVSKIKNLSTDQFRQNGFDDQSRDRDH